MPGTPASKGGVAEANEHLRQLYSKIEELETQLQGQAIYRDQLTNFQNENFELKELARRLQFQNQEMVNYLRERTNEVARLQSENKQLVEIVSDLANQRKAVDDWISLTNRAAHTISQSQRFKLMDRTQKQKPQQTVHNSNQVSNSNPVKTHSDFEAINSESNQKLSNGVSLNGLSSVVHVEMHDNEGRNYHQS